MGSDRDPTYDGPRDMMTDEPSFVAARAIRRELARAKEEHLTITPSPLHPEGEAHVRGVPGGYVTIYDQIQRLPAGVLPAVELLSALRAGGAPREIVARLYRAHGQHCNA